MCVQKHSCMYMRMHVKELLPMYIHTNHMPYIYIYIHTHIKRHITRTYITGLFYTHIAVLLYRQARTCILELSYTLAHTHAEVKGPAAPHAQVRTLSSARPSPSPRWKDAPCSPEDQAPYGTEVARSRLEAAGGGARAPPRPSPPNPSCSTC